MDITLRFRTLLVRRPVFHKTQSLIYITQYPMCNERNNDT